MPMIKEREIVLMQLSMYKLLTEHELASAIAEKLHRKAVDVLVNIGVLLTALKNDGLIWAGSLSNERGQSMWAACLTEKGKTQVR